MVPTLLFPYPHRRVNNFFVFTLPFPCRHCRQYLKYQDHKTPRRRSTDARTPQLSLIVTFCNMSSTDANASQQDSSGPVKTEENEGPASQVVSESALTSAVPPSQWDLLRAQLREKPHNPEGWNRLVALAEESGDIEKVKDSYEALLEMYPNTVSRDIEHRFIAPKKNMWSLEIPERAFNVPPYSSSTIKAILLS